MTTGIRWTSETWNPTTGCSKVSPGCAHCYAETLSLRRGWSRSPWTPENADENVVLHPERLLKPFAWKAPSRVFVNSMSDLFHELIAPDYIADVFAVMAATPQHTYQVLTKRPEWMAEILGSATWPALLAEAIARLLEDHRARRYMGLDPMPAGARVDLAPLEMLTFWGHPITEPLPNVWLGTSIENDRHTFRAGHLRATPAAVRFISAEPLLGPLPSLDLEGIDWLIVGGESGPGFRPMDHDWARDLRDRSLERGVAFFFKQSAARYTETGLELDGVRHEEYPEEYPDACDCIGRELGGHSEGCRFREARPFA